MNVDPAILDGNIADVCEKLSEQKNRHFFATKSNTSRILGVLLLPNNRP